MAGKKRILKIAETLNRIINMKKIKKDLHLQNNA
jgi:hypothetical protein